jgi:hypothetical protein
MHDKDLKSLSDDELLACLSQVLKDSRRCESMLIAHIAEVDARRLYAREACPSMHKYCTDVLHLSDAEAYFRITAARASRRFPVLLTMLEDGRIHLSGIEALAPHLDGLDRAARDAVLARATHKRARRTSRQLRLERVLDGHDPSQSRKRGTSAGRKNESSRCRPRATKSSSPQAPSFGKRSNAFRR